MTAQTAPLLTVSLLSGSTGPQTATGSTGTVQVFAGGPQTATGSTGTVQAGQPATPGVTAGTPRGPGGSVTAIDPSGGSQTATGSTGTIQLFPGGSPATAGGGPTSTEGTAPVPTRGLAATAGVLGASPATPSAAATTRRSGTLGRRTPLTATPQARTPVGLTALPARVRGTLPFTGEALGGALLLGLMLLALGVALARREPEGAAS
jgi:hypothetical protein